MTKLSLFLLGAAISLLHSNAHSQMLEWVQIIDGTGTTQGHGIAIDNSGNVNLTGNFTVDADLDPGAGTATVTGTTSFDIFNSQLTSAGTYNWGHSVTDAGGYEYARGVAYSAIDNSIVHLTQVNGSGIDFDPGAGVASFSSSGMRDGIIRKLDASGNFIWAKRIGNTANDDIDDVAIDASGNVFVVGGISGTMDLDPGAGTDFHTGTAPASYIVKLDVNGNYLWGVSYNDVDMSSIDVDAAGNVYATGRFSNTVDFDLGVGTHNETASGTGECFVLKLTSGGLFSDAWSFGGSDFEYGFSVKIDGNNDVLVGGMFYGTLDADPSAGTMNIVSNGDRDAFIIKYTNTGTALWAKSLGEASYDRVSEIAVDAGNHVFIAGIFQGTVDIDLGASVDNRTSNGSYDVFLITLDSDGTYRWGQTFGGTSAEGVNDLAVDGLSIYMTGNFTGTVDFDPDVAVVERTGTNDMYLQKLSISVILDEKNSELTLQASESDVLLNWVSGYTTEEGRFELERSEDMEVWNQIASIQANGADSYRYFDGNLATGMHYYRLYFVDQDGTKKILSSKGVDLNFGEAKLYPNPCSDYLVVNTEELRNDQFLEIRNSLGQIVLEAEVEDGNRNTVIDTDALISGFYSMILTDAVNGTSQHMKFHVIK